MRARDLISLRGKELARTKEKGRKGSVAEEGIHQPFHAGGPDRRRRFAQGKTTPQRVKGRGLKRKKNKESRKRAWREEAIQAPRGKE